MCPPISPPMAENGPLRGFVRSHWLHLGEPPISGLCKLVVDRISNAATVCLKGSHGYIVEEFMRVHGGSMGVLRGKVPVGSSPSGSFSWPLHSVGPCPHCDLT